MVDDRSMPRAAAPAIALLAVVLATAGGGCKCGRDRPYTPYTIGDGALKLRLQALATALDVDDCVLFAGSVSDAERDRWLERVNSDPSVLLSASPSIQAALPPTLQAAVIDQSADNSTPLTRSGARRPNVVMTCSK